MTLKKPWVKVCGLTQTQNALDCVDAGADAIGFVFYEKSPRNISIANAAKISTALPDQILTIGVFVDTSFEQIMEKVVRCRLKGVQLHGTEPPELVTRLLKEDLIVIKALFAARPPLLSEAATYKDASFILVEYGKGTLPGGNAESWDYGISRGLETKLPVILAGGLNPENIRAAIQTARPSAIDVSSGVEKSYGIKDIDKVKAFIARIKAIE
jgi:phosphoribosylanthranilate isomerase